jgi:hypothetical protein
VFDLAVARFYQNNGDDIKASFEVLMNENPILKQYNITGEMLLKPLAMMYGLQIGKRTPSPSKNDILSMDPSYVHSNWNKVCTAFIKTVEWLNQKGLTPSVSNKIPDIVSIVGVVAEKPDLLQNDAYSTSIFKWFIANSIAHSSRSLTANDALAKTYVQLLEHVKYGTPLNMPRIALTADDILLLDEKSIPYKRIIALMVQSGFADLRTGKTIVSTDMAVEYVFPKTAVKKFGLKPALINSLANRIPVSTETQKHTLNMLPTAYLVGFKRGYDETRYDDLDLTLENALMPIEAYDNFSIKLDVGKFEEFTFQRSKKIMEMLKNELAACFTE